MKKVFFKLALTCLSIAAFIVFGIFLENEAGIAFDTTYRLACAIACLYFMAKIAADYPGQRWPWIAISVAALTNVVFFLTPVFDRSTSRGEIIIFALPDVAIFMTAAAIYRPSLTEHDRAVRQQSAVGAILAAALSALIFAAAFIPDKKETASTEAVLSNAN